MCGIVGVIGNPKGKDILLKGLAQLEYRGYDSAGIYLADGQHLIKAVGPLKNLIEKVPENLTSQLGIGHTRWATHGKATEENAHPHLSPSGRFILVHNGVIENYQSLKETYLKEDVFTGETDSEVIVHLVEYFVNQGLPVKEALTATLKELVGSYAIGLIDQENPQILYAAKNKSPLLIGVGKNSHFIVSDALGILEETTKFIPLQDQEIALLTATSCEIENLTGQKITREFYEVAMDETELGKGTYPYYMLKEIDQQPSVIRKIALEYVAENQHFSKELLESLQASDHVYFVACGTSYHASRIGVTYFENWCDKPATALLASEVGRRFPKLSKKPFFIFLSQSGETADSRQVLVKVKENNYPTLTFTNVLGSTLARESDFALPLLAGPEIAVASTKAYTAEVAILACLAQALALPKEKINLFEELSLVANSMESLLSQRELLEKKAADFLKTTTAAFYIGRFLDYEVSLEAALKIKEISYIFAEGFAAGELKHGPIALIEEDTPVIAFITDELTAGLTRGNIEEVKARGAKVLTIAKEELANKNDDVILPNHPLMLMPLLTILPAQLLAYYATLMRGYDVDKPRNLAKSVTVE